MQYVKPTLYWDMAAEQELVSPHVSRIAVKGSTGSSSAWWQGVARWQVARACEKRKTKTEKSLGARTNVNDKHVSSHAPPQTNENTHYTRCHLCSEYYYKQHRRYLCVCLPKSVALHT